MHTRLKILRKLLKLSQTDFARRIGVTYGAYGDWERGRFPIPDARLRIICTEFNVRREWLETGAGDMFSPVENTPEPSFVESMMAMYRSLPPDYQKLWDELIKEILKSKGDPKQAAENVTKYIIGVQNASNSVFNGDILGQYKGD